MSHYPYGCLATPEYLKVKFYEIGFCDSDPITNGTQFDDSVCHKVWSSSQGADVVLSEFSYQSLPGTVNEIPAADYDQAYIIISNQWSIKGSYGLSNGQTFYTKSDGSITELETEYGVTTIDINRLSLMESANNCFFWGEDIVHGKLEMSLNASDNTVATNVSECNSATRIIGSIDLLSPVKIKSGIQDYKLDWLVRQMGFWVWNDGGNEPTQLRNGPIFPEFLPSN